MTRVMHVVSGGFSGATQVAIDLVEAAQQGGKMQSCLVLRRKRSTAPERVSALTKRGLSVHVLPGGLHVVTIAALLWLLRRVQPHVLVAHGFPEHLLARHAGVLARVPALVQVEHNARERYTPWKSLQASWLAPRTARFVGCSEGVRQQLLARGCPPERTVAIPNGILLEPFTGAFDQPHATRIAGIVMPARFARQKDHRTLIEAIALLRERGLRPPVVLAGGGMAAYRDQAQALLRQLGLADQVQMPGHVDRMPSLLMSHRICVLSTHYEGMPLSLVEGMAAGCAVVASDVVGVRELIAHGHNGYLVLPADARALADALETLLRDEGTAERMGRQAHADAHARHGSTLMTQRYEAMFDELAGASA
jgi:glycosyltransferase involved in cell wall biosynthesis